MGRKVEAQNLRLVKLPFPQSLKLSHLFGLIKERYEAGEMIVDMNCGDMIELSEPYKNGDKTIKYRNIWIWSKRRGYRKEYDDDFGGTLHYMTPGIFRLATKREKTCK